MKMIEPILLLSSIIIIIVMSVSVKAEPVQIFNETFDSSANWSLNGCTINASGDGLLKCDVSDKYVQFVHALPNLSTNTNNITIEFQARISNSGTGAVNVLFMNQNSTNPSSNNVYFPLIRDDSTGANGVGVKNCPPGSYFHVVNESSTTFNTWKFILWQNSSFSVYLNNTEKHNIAFGSACFGNMTYLQVGRPTDQSNIIMDNFTVYNGSYIVAPIIPDNTFPNVSVSFNGTKFRNNDIINFSGNVTDNINVLSANITYNISGAITHINFSLNANGSISNVTKLNCNGECVINFTMYATDTSNNVKQNSTLVVVSDKVIVRLDNPKDNNITHNKTQEFKFNLSESFGDKLNYTLWFATSTDFTQNLNMINSSNSTFDLNATVIYTYNTEFSGSINNTYYWKVNGTDNYSITFTSSVFLLNITNNITAYDVTNVTLTSLPVNSNNDVKCHYNITNNGGSQVNDNISLADLHWYVNNTQYKPANNLTTLKAGNVTNDANITCEVRINNGYGETSWTQYVNTSQATVGDITAPTFKGNRTSVTSITRDGTIDLFVNSTDNVAVDIIKVEVNNTQVKTNFTMTLDSGLATDGEWKYTYTTSIVGTHRLVFYSQDGSGNTGNTGNELTFEVTSLSGGDGSSGGGGGGGTITIEPIKDDCNIEFFPNFTSLSQNNIVKKIVLINNEFKTISPTFIINRSDLISLKGELEKIIPIRTTIEYSIILDNISIFRDDINITENYFDISLIMKSNECKNINSLIKVERESKSEITFQSLKDFLNEDITQVKLTKNVSFQLKFYQILGSIFLITSVPYIRMKKFKKMNFSTKGILILFSTLVISLFIKIFIDLVK